MNALIFDPQRTLEALLRQDFTAFVRKVFATLNPGTPFEPNWHIDALCHAVSEEWRAYNKPFDTRMPFDRDRRLLVTMPPRHLKSIVASVAFPAWVLGNDPSKRFIVASYGGDLAAKHARDFRAVVQADWYRLLFPKFSLSTATATEIITSAKGGRLAVSVGGAVTGLGADIIIIDDLMKASDAQSAVERQRVRDFYEGTLLSRRDDKSRSIIIAIQQRLHAYDLAGYLMEQGGFTHLNLPAIASRDRAYDLGRGRTMLHGKGEALFSAREPLHVLEKMRAEMGTVAFSSQYLQDPTPQDGGLLRWERIETYEDPPPRSQCLQVVQSWDTAMKAGPQCDFSVGTTWGYYDGAWLLLDVCRVRLDFPDLIARVNFERRRWKSDRILIEDAGSGIALLQALREGQQRLGLRPGSQSWRPVAYSPHMSKEVRFDAQSEKLQNGTVRFPVDAPWMDTFKEELLSFPQSRHDDQVDSVTQFVDWAGLFERRLVTGRRNIRRR